MPKRVTAVAAAAGPAVASLPAPGVPQDPGAVPHVARSAVGGAVTMVAPGAVAVPAAAAVAAKARPAAAHANPAATLVSRTATHVSRVAIPAALAKAAAALALVVQTPTTMTTKSLTKPIIIKIRVSIAIAR